jgi:DNA polymerase V
MLVELSRPRDWLMGGLFLFLGLFLLVENDLFSYASKMRNTILKWTGIPTSVGIAPTKSLAKISNKIARKFPSQTKHVYVLDTDYKRFKALNYFPLNDI